MSPPASQLLPPAAGARPAPSSLPGAALAGALGFGLASLAVFATVAFAERWMYSRLGVTGAYLVWTALFLVLGGGALNRLVAPPWRGRRFLGLFALAFFAYSAGWTGAYFLLGGAAGEWAGSLLGSVLLGLALALGFGVRSLALRLSLLLFAANSAGYFAGAALYQALGRPVGMLLWGAAYGLCLGAALGAALHLLQTAPPQRRQS
jgi:hypothetical protein